MKKEKVIILVTEDYHNCELCRGNFTSSVKVSVGNWSFGTLAYSHCYNEVLTKQEIALEELFKHLNIEIKDKSFYWKYPVKNVKDKLESLGFEVEIQKEVYRTEDDC